MRPRLPWPIARTRQRAHEFDVLFGRVRPGALGDALELGGGDGYLASQLRPLCRRLVTSDRFPSRYAHGGAIARVTCDATALPFADATFDLIFSSSVLEHVRERATAYAEMQRCLRPGGLMLHVMPSRAWKLLQLALYYPHRGLQAVEWILDRAAGHDAPIARSPEAQRWQDGARAPLTLRRVLMDLVPSVHGEYDGHLAELRGFASATWRRELATAGFAVHRIVRLPLYSGYGFGLGRLRAAGQRLGLHAHNAFLATHARAALPPWAEALGARDEVVG